MIKDSIDGILGITDIKVNQQTGAGYLSSDRLNAIVPFNNTTIVAGVAFNISTRNAGYVECTGINFPTNQYLYVGLLAHCTAEPNDGFEFMS